MSNQSESVFDMDIWDCEEKMRYFIFYPPSNLMRAIDIDENMRIEDIIGLVRQKFHLKVHNSGPEEVTIVLNYNGSDLKPKWSLADLNIPPGSIIRCIYKEKQAPQLYVHCGFNKKIIKLFDTSITNQTPISTVRIKISNQIGLPLSTFCLETIDNTKRLYDQMQLYNYDIKVHGHVYLKIWKGHEKFISSCMRGYAKQYSSDDLTRHYQTQVALHIAAFYGHMELASSVMQYGARSDHPVGEHPSRQWSLETSEQTIPEILKCPIHIAVERGHVKMVDLFVRQSILCTQIPHPITGRLPYELALDCAMSSTSKDEKQRYHQIYFYLHDKQENLKVPLNANGDYVSNLLSSTSITLTVRTTLAQYHYVSLPFYCRLMRWTDGAREKIWKKFGGRFATTSSSKRIYPERGLLGYKVLIDGYNNTFEAPTDQIRRARSERGAHSDITDRYKTYSDEERDTLVQLEMHMKECALTERQRTKQIAAANLQQARRPGHLSRQTSVNVRKVSAPPTTQRVDNISSSCELSHSPGLSSIIASDIKAFQSMLSSDILSTNNFAPKEVNNPKQTEKSPKVKQETKQITKVVQVPATSAAFTEEKKRPVPFVFSPTAYASLTNQIDKVNPHNKQVFQPTMSSVDAFLISSTRLALEAEQVQATKRQDLLTQLENTVQEYRGPRSEVSMSRSSDPISTTAITDHNSLDVDSFILLPDNPSSVCAGPVKSHIDLDIRQSTFQPYERYASASIRTTAVNCLQEATYFKRKSWLKQVEISQDIIRNKVQRRINRANHKISKDALLLPLRATNTTGSYQRNTVKVK